MSRYGITRSNVFTVRVWGVFCKFQVWSPHLSLLSTVSKHDDVIKWKHFPSNWPFVQGFHHKGQWRGALMFSLICVWINNWVNNREAGDLRCYRAHYDVIVMNWENYSQVRCTNYFWSLRSFWMFTGPIFQTKLHLLCTVLLSGFQSVPGL